MAKYLVSVNLPDEIAKNHTMDADYFVGMIREAAHGCLELDDREAERLTVQYGVNDNMVEEIVVDYVAAQYPRTPYHSLRTDVERSLDRIHSNAHNRQTDLLRARRETIEALMSAIQSGDAHGLSELDIDPTKI